MRLPDVASIPAMPSFHDEISIAIEEQPTTPPNISHSNVQPEGTSLTGKQASSLALNSTHMDPEERLTATRFDTAGWVIESISAQEFLDHYLPQAGPPSAPERPDPKEQMTKLAQPIKREIQLYDKQVITTCRSFWHLINPCLECAELHGGIVSDGQFYAPFHCALPTDPETGLSEGYLACHYQWTVTRARNLREIT